MLQYLLCLDDSVVTQSTNHFIYYLHHPKIERGLFEENALMLCNVVIQLYQWK